MTQLYCSRLWTTGLLTILSIVGCSTAPAPVPVQEGLPLHVWAEVTTPRSGPANSIGSPSAGCLAGGVTLPPDGPGFEMMRLTRRRFYGHPSLISFLQNYGSKLKKQQLGPVLVGDLGQPRGGPMPSGHQSHQSGLDVDLWYWHPADLKNRNLTLDEREQLAALSVLTPSPYPASPSLATANTPAVSSELFTAEQIQFLKTAAAFPDVDRIFVNPNIKKYLCEREKNPADREWLHKLRPWWGHDDHFHVRLNCPLDSTDCIPTAKIEEGSGCGTTLDWWFTAEAAQPPALLEPEKPRELVLPLACQVIGES
ncbi:MAG: penicillin-insensitive murein endopeptidase [Methylotenera sp.]|nr:penicillin-insensitive murein endopeptidase [Oligoflexia bacterium]